MQDLTPRQRDVYDFIAASIATGLPPTTREIATEFGIRSPNGVRCHLQALEAKGWITVAPLLSRGIRLADQSKPGRIPLVGMVSAGTVIYSPGAKR